MKYVITLNGRTYEVEAETAEPLPIDQYDGVYTSESTEQSVCVDCREQTSAPSGTDSPAEGDTVAAPMPGTIVKINVSVGDAVKKGSVLLVLEAMKMENEIVAAKDGVVARILTNKGSAVEANTPLLVLK